MPPLDARPWRRTAGFTEAATPAALLKAHASKDGARGLISESLLTPLSAPGVIEPTILREVQPLGPVRFHVEFHRLPETAP